MANPLLFFENIMDDGTLTSSSEASGFADDNINNWRVGTVHRWKANSVTPPATLTVDLGVGVTATPTTAVIAGHNLSTAGARWHVEYSNDNFVTDTNNAFSEVTPTNDLPNLQLFSGTGAQRYWRIYIDTAAGDFSVAPQVGIVTLGRRLDFTVGAQPDLDPYHRDTAKEITKNENGSPLGINKRFLRKRFQISYDAPGLTDADFFDPVSGLTFDSDFQTHADDKPFWFAWNTDVDAQEVYLCTLDTDVRMPFIGTTARRGLFMEFEAYREIS